MAKKQMSEAERKGCGQLFYSDKDTVLIIKETPRFDGQTNPVAGKWVERLFTLSGCGGVGMETIVEAVPGSFPKVQYKLHKGVDKKTFLMQKTAAEADLEHFEMLKNVGKP